VQPPGPADTGPELRTANYRIQTIPPFEHLGEDWERFYASTFLPDCVPHLVCLAGSTFWSTSWSSRAPSRGRLNATV
jgi:hypothetical protein